MTGLIERSDKCFDEHYNNLSAEQIGMAYSLRQVGWFLSFVRVLGEEQHLAFFENDGKFATVNHLGEVDYNPTIPVRKQGKAA